MTRLTNPITVTGLLSGRVSNNRPVLEFIGWGVVAGFLLAGPAFSDDSPAIPPPAKRQVDFVKDIQPLLREKCHQCHGSSRKEAGLRLDRRDDATNGGKSGPAFVAGKSAESLLIKNVAGVDPDLVMPPDGDRLTDDQIGLLRAWIDQGAKWPDPNQRRFQ